jgi:hypothetical protein
VVCFRVNRAQIVMRLSALSLLLLCALISGCDRPLSNGPSSSSGARTFSSFDPITSDNKVLPAHSVKFEQAELSQVMKLYAELSNRSVIYGANLPEVKIAFVNQAPMKRVQALQAIDTVLASQNITVVCLGTAYVKVVPQGAASVEPGPVVELPADQLPDSSSFLIRIVPLKNITASQSVGAIQPFAKMPNSIIAIGPGGSRAAAAAKANVPNLPAFFGPKDNHILILRDYSSNVRRMLQVIEALEKQ